MLTTRATSIPYYFIYWDISIKLVAAENYYDNSITIPNEGKKEARTVIEIENQDGKY